MGAEIDMGDQDQSTRRPRLAAPLWNRAELPWINAASKPSDGVRKGAPLAEGPDESRYEDHVRKAFELLLAATDFGRHDSFFDLGGDSLQGVQLIHILEDLLETPISPVGFFLEPTVAAMGQRLRESMTADWPNP